MSYEKQTWENGDIITAEKLNHIESGVAAGGCWEAYTDTETNDVLLVVTEPDIGGARRVIATYAEAVEVVSSGRYAPINGYVLMDINIKSTIIHAAQLTTDGINYVDIVF